ncbi:MAG: DUF2264 domain-containing protein [Chloroflexaceae bacterium]|jgi:hypothetical protein|nr:DUF2264 domain-containing protein [Chloroflexaceae bacterium]
MSSRLGAIATNPLRTRADMADALRDLLAPLEPYASPGGARVRLGHTGAHYADACAELEGFARPLWGLAPLAAGGGAYAHWQRVVRGLAAGSDPQHPEFWGWPSPRNQRLVEMAAIGFALVLAPEQCWLPLRESERANLVAWLHTINRTETSDNNWHFFRVLVNMGLARVGVAPDQAASQRSLNRIEDFYLGDGWYNDGPAPRVQRDYYLPFALHFYGLIYAEVMGGTDPERARHYRERAARFAHDFVAWFAPGGAALPFGRSMTYRFAQGAFWGALAYAGVEALPWGVLKGLLLRHLRWWLQQPIFNGDGTLSIGYVYPNLHMAEDYNSPGSPYWALKAFLPLALPGDHPFWLAEELPLPELPPVSPQPHAGMLICRDGGHMFALSGLQHGAWARGGEAKYSRMAYSTQFGVSVPAGPYGLVQGAFDNTLALSDDGLHFRARTEPLEANITAAHVYSRWQPWPDVEVQTWLLPRLPWHVRIHRIRSARRLLSAEGGWALDRSGDDPGQPQGSDESGPGFALARYPAGWSGLRDLAGGRRGEVVRPSPNTNLLHPRTVLPTLHGAHEPGEHWLVCAVIGRAESATWDELWATPPQIDA